MISAFRRTLVALLITPAAILHAQERTGTIRGQVVDAESSAPLSFVTVRVVELHRAFQTHEDGAFAFIDVPPGQYTLSAQRLGYAPLELSITLRAGQDTTVRVELEPRPVELTRTVITGTIGERSASEVISSTSVIAGSSLDRALDGTLAGTVSGQAGVSSASMGAATAKPVLRGLSGDRVLVLEDGARPGDMSGTGADHAVAVDPLTVGRVEIVRGPMSLLYGSSALGGVINAVRDEVPTSPLDGLHGTVTLQGATVNSGASAGGEARFPLGNFGVRAEASVRTAGDTRTPVARLENTGVETYGLALGVGRPFESGHVGVSYRGYFNEYGLPGGFVGAHPGGVDIRMRRHTVRTMGDWHGDDGIVRNLSGSAGVTTYGHDEITGSGSVGTSFDQVTMTADVLAELAPHGPFSNGAVGARVQYRDITTAGSLRTPSTHDWTAGVFLVEEAAIGRLTLQGGVRGDVARYEPREASTVTVHGEDIPTLPRTFSALSGAVGTLWDVGGGVRMGANVSRAFRTPDFNELYSDGPHLAAYSYDVGNPRLDAETGSGLDVFIRAERARWNGEVAAFHNRFSNYIFPRNTGEIGRQGERWKFQYAGRDVVLSGGEAQVSVRPLPALVFDAMASLVIGRVRGERDSIPAIGDEPARLSSRYLPLLPPLNGRVSARWDRPAWFAGAGVKMAARQDRVGDFETETPAYQVVELSAGIRRTLASRLHTFTLRVDNALDTSYRDHLSRTSDIIPEAGRNVSLLYRLIF